MSTKFDDTASSKNLFLNLVYSFLAYSIPLTKLIFLSNKNKLL